MEFVIHAFDCPIHLNQVETFTFIAEQKGTSAFLTLSVVAFARYLRNSFSWIAPRGQTMPDSPPLSLMFSFLVQYNVLNQREGTNLPKLIPSSRPYFSYWVLGFIVVTYSVQVWFCENFKMFSKKEITLWSLLFTVWSKDDIISYFHNISLSEKKPQAALLLGNILIVEYL